MSQRTLLAEEGFFEVNKQATIHGIDMRWSEQGEGFPVVLIHGIPTSSALWRHVVPLISDARVLAFEMVGYGTSIQDGRGRDISVARQADYVADWMNQLGIKRAVLGGHDLGGGVAQTVAVQHRNLCSGLFLTNSICYDSWPIPSVKALRATAFLSRHLPNAIAKQIVRTLMYRGHDSVALAHEALNVHWQPYGQNGGARALIRQIEQLDVQDTLAISDALATLDIPARLVWGAADQFQTVRYGERLARDLSAPLRLIEGGKHFTPEDHPEIIAQELNALVQDIRQSSAKTA